MHVILQLTKRPAESVMPQVRNNGSGAGVAGLAVGYEVDSDRGEVLRLHGFRQTNRATAMAEARPHFAKPACAVITTEDQLGGIRSRRETIQGHEMRHVEL